MVRSVLSVAMLLSLTSCYSFKSVPPYDGDATDSQDVDGDMGAPDDLGAPECETMGDECSGDDACGELGFIECVCGECVDADYAYVTLNYDTDLVVRSAEMTISAGREILEFEGTERPIMLQEGRLEAGELTGYAAENRHVLALVDHDASEATVAVRKGAAELGDLAGRWVGTGFPTSARSDDVEIELRVADDGAIESAVVAGVSATGGEFQLSENGELEGSFGGGSYHGQVTPDATLILLSSESGVVILVRPLDPIRSENADWRVMLLANDQTGWFTGKGVLTVNPEFDRVSGSLELHRPGTELRSEETSGDFSADGERWSSTIELSAIDGYDADVEVSGWRYVPSPLLVGGTRARLGLTLWFESPESEK